MGHQPSPFLHPPSTAAVDSLAVLHLKRNALLPVHLRSTADDGYAEGAVTNTRFGSFPHSTLIGLPWGSQVRASRVDTGSRGRKGRTLLAHPNEEAGSQADIAMAKANKEEEQAGNDPGRTQQPSRKRKTPEEKLTSAESPTIKKVRTEVFCALASSPAQAAVTPVEANSGFIHILPPTPEAWTASLDHRTQVVYTPDYSYILQRLRVRPGDSIIEAGAGSGSFTHAAARAVFNGYRDRSSVAMMIDSPASQDTERRGQVYSYEFHAPRVETLHHELMAHGLDDVVTLTHRDVCTDGFGLPLTPSDPSATVTTNAVHPPAANAVFLDLPAPWLALPHLVRSPRQTAQVSRTSVLHPHLPIYLCTFSPCIEQVMATAATLRAHGWREIRMVAVHNRRLDVRRERVGLREEGLRGVVASPADVAEAVARLREVERGMRERNARGGSDAAAPVSAVGADRPQRDEQAPQQQQIQQEPRPGLRRQEDVPQEERPRPPQARPSSKALRQSANQQAALESRQLYKEGTLVHRSESDVKTHTSYLVFAVLPVGVGEVSD